MTPTPTELCFSMNLDLLAGGLVASDSAAIGAMRFAYDHFKIIIEPGAAVALAAVLDGKIDIQDKTIAVVVTGGNIDTDRFCALLNDEKI